MPADICISTLQTPLAQRCHVVVMQFHCPSGEHPDPAASARRAILFLLDSEAPERVANIAMRKSSMVKCVDLMQVPVLRCMRGGDMDMAVSLHESTCNIEEATMMPLSFLMSEQLRTWKLH